MERALQLRYKVAWAATLLRVARHRTGPVRGAVVLRTPRVHVDRHGAVDERVSAHIVLSPATDEYAVLDGGKVVTLNGPSALEVVQICSQRMWLKAK